MNYINETKLAFYLSVVSIITVIIGVIIGVGFSALVGTKVLILIAALIGVFVLPYFSFKIVLNKKEKIWGISLKTGETYERFEGSSYLKFYLGFCWRVIIMNVLVTTITNTLGIESALFDLITSFAVTYFALYWLFISPYGNTVIIFNVKLQEPEMESLSSLPVINPIEILSSERKTSKESYFSVIKNIAQGSLGSIFILGYIGVGLVQLAAIYDFFREGWQWWGIPSGIASTFIAYIPLIGNIAGFYSAYTIWEWPFWGAFLLFFWPIVLMLVAGLIGAAQYLFENKT